MKRRCRCLTLHRTSTGVDIFFSLIFSYFCFFVAACGTCGREMKMLCTADLSLRCQAQPHRASRQHRHHNAGQPASHSTRSVRMFSARACPPLRVMFGNRNRISSHTCGLKVSLDNYCRSCRGSPCSVRLSRLQTNVNPNRSIRFLPPCVTGHTLRG